jgi:hypothetical protein
MNKVSIQGVIGNSHKGEKTAYGKDSSPEAVPRISRSYGQQNEKDNEDTKQTGNNSDAWMALRRLIWKEP